MTYPEKKKKVIKHTPEKKKNWYKQVGIILAVICLIIVLYVVFNLINQKAEGLSIDEVEAMIKKHDFFDKYINPESKGFYNKYKEKVIRGNKIIFDEALNLMWQQGGSEEQMKYEEAKKYIEELNHKGYDGFNDWRLPTLEEAMSLTESEGKNDGLYIDPVFDKKQGRIWTSDLLKGYSAAWVVHFDGGLCYGSYFYSEFYVRAVR